MKMLDMIEDREQKANTSTARVHRFLTKVVPSTESKAIEEAKEVANDMQNYLVLAHINSIM